MTSQSRLETILEKALNKRRSNHNFRQLHAIQRQEGKLFHNGQWILDFASNDYLALSHHPLLRTRAASWAEKYGTGSCASRLVNGTLELHKLVEEKLARFKYSEAALLFASGWQANASLIPALNLLSQQETGQDALFFTDKLNHASLHIGCAAAGIRQNRYRHNDLAHLETLLKRHSHQAGLKFIVTESVFSMDGDRADIPALRYLADKFDAALYIDEAHATGILGKEGRGLSQGLADITMSTASKALGGMGAFITGSQKLCDFLVNFASGFIYSTALPPPVLGALDAALDLMPDMEPERAAIQEKASFLRKEIAKLGFVTEPSSTQIIPIHIGSAEKTLIVAQSLKEQGFFCGAIRPPTVPQNTSRLRVTLNADHTQQDVTHFIKALKISLENNIS
ncbi:aminotransferase class I/II-fold pyridoxal phosphate-dependent enzyme [Aristophania vespae]|uniref:Aminotransferase class I/II-fold pyridoxal phosphate-dependent enzyme n=1 Tax=Aristophania vespae TaxID=2697033 RepID=A0A6P1NBX5_9PROT|nr:8-amino-7-oxononanoate synthase [Aristophania vespae]QHI95013.1 aminotransferase class I/II-fold pyridoxal phosphate-dependent enzyme [Aristophania vespae]